MCRWVQGQVVVVVVGVFGWWVSWVGGWVGNVTCALCGREGRHAEGGRCRGGQAGVAWHGRLMGGRAADGLLHGEARSACSERWHAGPARAAAR